MSTVFHQKNERFSQGHQFTYWQKILLILKITCFTLPITTEKNINQSNRCIYLMIFDMIFYIFTGAVNRSTGGHHWLWNWCSRNSDVAGEKGRRGIHLVDIRLALPLPPGGDVAVHDLTAPSHRHRGGRAAGLRGEVDLRLARGREGVLPRVRWGVVQHRPHLQLVRLRLGLSDWEQAARRVLFLVDNSIIQIW